MFCCFGSRKDSCVFCNIKESIETRVIKETDELLAFKDRSPSAKIHFLVIPKQHVKTVNSLDENDTVLLSKMIDLGKTILREHGYNPDEEPSNIRLGFHVPPFNSVNHLHMHVIGLPFNNKFRELKYKAGCPWYIDASAVLDRLGK